MGSIKIIIYTLYSFAHLAIGLYSQISNKIKLHFFIEFVVEAVERSSDAYARARMAEAHKADLYDGPDKPETLVRRDERRFIEAVNSGIPYQVGFPSSLRLTL